MFVKDHVKQYSWLLYNFIWLTRDVNILLVLLRISTFWELSFHMQENSIFFWLGLIYLVFIFPETTDIELWYTGHVYTSCNKNSGFSGQFPGHVPCFYPREVNTVNIHIPRNWNINSIQGCLEQLWILKKINCWLNKTKIILFWSVLDIDSVPTQCLSCDLKNVVHGLWSMKN